MLYLHKCDMSPLTFISEEFILNNSSLILVKVSKEYDAVLHILIHLMKVYEIISVALVF